MNQKIEQEIIFGIYLMYLNLKNTIPNGIIHMIATGF